MHVLRWNVCVIFVLIEFNTKDYRKASFSNFPTPGDVVIKVQLKDVVVVLLLSLDDQIVFALSFTNQIMGT